jgi:hypothetical protein
MHLMNCDQGQNRIIGCLILLDDKDTLDAIRLFLELYGARVLVATAGRDGLDLVGWASSESHNLRSIDAADGWV